jgi:nitrous oxide reductase
MDEHRKPLIARRDLLRTVALVGAAAGTIGAASQSPESPAKKPADRGKRKSQYQPNAAEVRAFYRVNSYPQK